MIKVEHTKKHTLSYYYGRKEYGVDKQALVTDGKLVLVECSRYEAILRQIHGVGQYWIVLNVNGWLNDDDKFYKPILISETEKIEVGDWVCAKMSKGLRYVTKMSTFSNQFEDDGLISKQEPSPHCHTENYYKILALPEHFSPQQLQMIVDGKLKDGDKILLECENKRIYNNPDIRKGDFTYQNIIKLNPHITIYPVEEKMVPISIAEKAFEAGYNYAVDLSHIMGLMKNTNSYVIKIYLTKTNGLNKM